MVHKGGEFSEDGFSEDEDDLDNNRRVRKRAGSNNKPTSISHLLSDERTNREVLRALRAWDPYVFKKDAPARPVSAYPSWDQKQQDGRAK